MFILGLFMNPFNILRNISIVVGITHRVFSCWWGIYVWLVVIDILIGTKFSCGIGGRIKSNIRGGGHCQSD